MASSRYGHSQEAHYSRHNRHHGYNGKRAQQQQSYFCISAGGGGYHGRRQQQQAPTRSSEFGFIGASSSNAYDEFGETNETVGSGEADNHHYRRNGGGKQQRKYNHYDKWRPPQGQQRPFSREGGRDGQFDGSSFSGRVGRAADDGYVEQRSNRKNRAFSSAEQYNRNGPESARSGRSSDGRKAVATEEKPVLRQCGDWQEYRSSSGKTYYYNVNTEVSQWEKPLGWIDGDLEKRETAVSSSSDKHSRNKRSRAKKRRRSDRKWRGELAEADEPPTEFDQFVEQNDVVTPVAELAEDVGQNSPNTSSSSHFRETKRRRVRENLLVESGGELRKDEAHSLADEIGESRFMTTANREKGPVEAVKACDEVANRSRTNSPNLLSAGGVDLNHLPHVLVKIAQQWGIDLSKKGALEKMQAYLTAQLKQETSVGATATAEDGEIASPTLQTAVDERTAISDDEPSTKAQQPTSSSCRDEPAPRETETVTAEEVEEAGASMLRPPPAPPLKSSMIVRENREWSTRQRRELCKGVPAPSELTGSLRHLYEPTAVGHVTNWAAEHFENQARWYASESTKLSLKLSENNADLKCARSLVRSAEISSTLLENKFVAFLSNCVKLRFTRQQYQLLNASSSPQKLNLSLKR